MRLGTFFVINVVAALLLGGYSYAQGSGALSVLFTIVITLVVLQLAYALWLVAVSMMQRKDDKTAEDLQSAPPRSKIVSDPGNN